MCSRMGKVRITDCVISHFSYLLYWDCVVILTNDFEFRFLQNLDWIQVEHGMPGAWLAFKLEI